MANIPIGMVSQMTEQSIDATTRLRLLECWLPLAQQINQDLVWGYASADLEALILAASTDLVQTDSATTARAVLWMRHLRNRSEHL